MTNDVEALDSLVTDSVVTLFQAGLTLIGAIVVILLYLDVEAGAAHVLRRPALAGGSIWFRIVSAGAFRRTRETIGSITAYLQETLSGIRVVRSFGQEPAHEARFAELNEDNREANMVTVTLNAAYFPAVEMLSGVARRGDRPVRRLPGDRTVTSRSAPSSPSSPRSRTCSNRSSSSPSCTPPTSRGWPRWRRSSSCSTSQPDLTDAPHAVELGRIRGRDRASRTSPSATSRVRPPATGRGRAERGERAEMVLALEHIDLVIPRRADRRAGGRHRGGQVHDGEARRPLLRPHRGAGAGGRPRPARGHQRTRCARRWGSCPRRRSCSPARSRENIAFGHPDADERQIEQAAAAVGAEQFIAELPDGYDTEVGERGAQLSAGQRQLIAFARALIADPRILILDEATSNVDLHTEGRIEAGAAPPARRAAPRS